jgi:nicotinamidase-related amidase
MSRTALIIVDAQNDFLPPTGALAVPDGQQVIPVIQDLLGSQWDWDMVIASQVR